MIMRNKTPQAVRGRRRAETLAALAFLAPSLIGVSLFVVFPLIDTVRRSFCSVGGAFVGLANYATLFKTQAFLLAAGNTLKFLGVSVPLLLALSLAAALLAQRAPSWFKTSFLLPLAIPVASLALLWQTLFADHGVLNGALTSLGLAAVPWMTSDTAFGVLVASYLWKNIGYDMVLWIGGLSNIPLSQYEAAQVDGAGRFRQFISITLPWLSPTFYIVAVLSILNAFKVFREAYLVAGNYPHESMYLLQHLFNNWFARLDMDKLCAAATLAAGVIFALIALLGRMWGQSPGKE